MRDGRLTILRMLVHKTFDEACHGSLLAQVGKDMELNNLKKECGWSRSKLC